VAVAQGREGGPGVGAAAADLFTGDLLTAWEADGQVYHARVARPAGTVTRAHPPGPAGKRSRPAVAANDRGYCLAWADAAGPNPGVCWQVFDAAGTPQGEQGRASAPAPAAVAPISRGRFLILY
jgi:hypothetical protein